MVKEVKFRHKTDDYDFEFKMKHILRLLEEEDKVKVVVMFRGREVVHRDIGYRIIEEVIRRVGDKAIVEKGAGIDGRDMHAILAPRIIEVPKAPKAPKKPKAETPEAPATEAPIQ